MVSPDRLAEAYQRWPHAGRRSPEEFAKIVQSTLADIRRSLDTLGHLRVSELTDDELLDLIADVTTGH